jgi:hypothetical protein
MSLEQVLETRRSARKVAWILVSLVAATVMGTGTWLLTHGHTRVLATSEFVDPLQIMTHGQALPAQPMKDLSVVYE